jgi:hypothetical protein
VLLIVTSALVSEILFIIAIEAYSTNLMSTDLCQEIIIPEPEPLGFAQTNVFPTNSSEASAVFR